MENPPKPKSIWVGAGRQPTGAIARKIHQSLGAILFIANPALLIHIVN